MESRFPGVRRLLRLGSVDRDLDEELAFHFEQTVEELVAQGSTERQAWEQARQRFGDEAHWRAELQRSGRAAASRRRRADLLATAWENLRFAARGLVRAPGFTVAVVLTFALGLGANATMFGIIDRILLQPPSHIVNPDDVRHVRLDRYIDFRQARDTIDSWNFPAYKDLIASKTLAGVAAYTGSQDVTVGRGAEAQQFKASMASGNFFALLGTRPALGRFFTTQEDRIGGEPVVVISNELWQEQYGSSASVLGKTIDFGEGPYTIIGVAPKGFTGVGLQATDFWLPLETAAPGLRNSTAWKDSRNWWWLRVVARLNPGVEPVRAEAEATALHLAGMREQIASDNYRDDTKVVTGDLIAARGAGAGGESVVAKWLAGVSLLVLLIACANVANLLLARAIQQRREVAVRVALGISRRRLVAAQLTESLLLAALGGAAALLVVAWGGELVRSVLLPDIAWPGTMGPRVLTFVIAMVVLCGALAGGLPAIQASRPGIAASIRASGRSIVGSGMRTRAALTMLQAALSIALLAGAGLFIRSLHNVNSLNLGFNPVGVYGIEEVFEGDPDDDAKTRYFFEAAERIRSIPGVTSATVSIGVPFWSNWGLSLTIPGIDSIPTIAGGQPFFFAVDHGYFRTMDLSVIQGRGIEETDSETSQRIAVVNETMARILWPDGSALGHCLQINERPCAEIVGIVENARINALVDEPETMQYFVPVRQRPVESAPEVVLFRTQDPNAVAAAPRAAMAADASVRFATTSPFTDLIDPERRSWLLGATMFTVFGILALIVASIGLYSVLAFEVLQRTQEIGVRAALGASRKQIVSLVLSRGVRLTAIGAALGLLVTLLLTPRMQSMLFGVDARDPVTFLLVPALLLAVAALASGVPALRAASVDPNVALRSDQ